MPYNPSEAVERFRERFTSMLPFDGIWDEKEKDGISDDMHEIEEFWLAELALSRQQVLSEVEEMIGEDETLSHACLKSWGGCYCKAKNQLRAELRQKLATLTHSKEK